MSVYSVSLNSTPVISIDNWKKQPAHPLSRRVIETLHSGSSFKNRELTQSIMHLEGQELETVLNEVVEAAMASDDPVKAMREFATACPLDQLQHVIQKRYPTFKGAVHAAQEQVRSAQYYLQRTQDTLHPTLKTRLQTVLHSMSGALESFLSAFGLADFFKPAEGEMHAEMKSNRIFMLLHLFTLVSAVALPILGAALAAEIVGAFVLFIVVLSLVYPHIRSASQTLPSAENWSKKYCEGKLDVTDGRKQIMDAMAHALITSKNVKKHPMLIGKSGVGKTETVKSFVAAIERGDYPELKGKKVFYFNTATLVHSSEMLGGGNKILQHIKDKIGKHGEKMILVFDEIHLACEKNERSDIGNQLKTLLDPGNENFPYVIGMTTEEEFFKYIYNNNKAFARRFKCIPLDNTDPGETTQILRDTLLRQNPDILVKKEAMDYLVQATSRAFAHKPQPAAALHILSQCIQKTAGSQRSCTQDRIEELHKKIRHRESEGAIGQGEDLLTSNDSQKNMNDLQGELAFWENQWVQEKAKTLAFYKAREKLSSTKTALFQSVLKVSKFASESFDASQKKEASTYLLLSYFLGPVLDAYVQREASALKICATIDCSLIDTVIAEEIQNEKQVEKGVSQGKLLSENSVANSTAAGRLEE